MLTLLEIVKRTTEFFQKRGLENPRLNAELLLSHALGLKRMELYLQFERPVTEAELTRLRPLVKRRGDREPLQYIVGQVEFHGLTLRADRRALIPRPETERFVEIILEKWITPPGRVLDLGTGSGAIALALAKAWPHAEVVAVDASKDALALAEENATQTGLSARVRFMASDWFSALKDQGRFELIVSNPPYLSDAETDATLPEVREFEPRAALSAGPGGREALEKIIARAPAHLSPEGGLALETGIEQHAALREFATRHGFGGIESRQDLTGRDRYFLAALETR